MINLSCPNCRGALKVPDERAGSRGRCPRCKSPIRIPAGPGPSRRPSRRTPVCRNEKLKTLYDRLVKLGRLPIRHHSIIEDDKIALELLVGGAGRRQSLSVFLYDQPEEGVYLCVASRIGSVSEKQSANVILKAAYYMVGARVCISPDNTALVLAERPIDSLSHEEFAFLVKNVAAYADRLEMSLFEWDAV